MITSTAVSLTTQEERMVYAMQLLGDKTRFKIFKLLSSGDELCVSQIAEALNISVSAVSQHFRSFEMLGIVHKERMGQRICYELNNDDLFVQELTTLTKKG